MEDSLLRIAQETTLQDLVNFLSHSKQYSSYVTPSFLRSLSQLHNLPVAKSLQELLFFKKQSKAERDVIAVQREDVYYIKNHLPLANPAIPHALRAPVEIMRLALEKSPECASDECQDAVMEMISKKDLERIHVLHEAGWSLDYINIIINTQDMDFIKEMFDLIFGAKTVKEYYYIPVDQIYSDELYLLLHRYLPFSSVNNYYLLKRNSRSLYKRIALQSDLKKKRELAEFVLAHQNKKLLELAYLDIENWERAVANVAILLHVHEKYHQMNKPSYFSFACQESFVHDGSIYCLLGMGLRPTTEDFINLAKNHQQVALQLVDLDVPEPEKVYKKIAGIKKVVSTMLKAGYPTHPKLFLYRPKKDFERIYELLPTQAVLKPKHYARIAQIPSLLDKALADHPYQEDEDEESVRDLPAFPGEETFQILQTLHARGLYLSIDEEEVVQYLGDVYAPDPDY